MQRHWLPLGFFGAQKSGFFKSPKFHVLDFYPKLGIGFFWLRAKGEYNKPHKKRAPSLEEEKICYPHV